MKYKVNTLLFLIILNMTIWVCIALRRSGAKDKSDNYKQNKYETLSHFSVIA